MFHDTNGGPEEWRVEEIDSDGEGGCMWRSSLGRMPSSGRAASTIGCKPHRVMPGKQASLVLKQGGQPLLNPRQVPGTLPATDGPPVKARLSRRRHLLACGNRDATPCSQMGSWSAKASVSNTEVLAFIILPVVVTGRGWPLASLGRRYIP